MIRIYRFLSAFLVRVMLGNIITAAVSFFLGSACMTLVVYLNVFTVYLAVLWVVFKLMQAHFPDVKLDIPYSGKTRRTLKIIMIVSAVVCFALLAVNVPGYFDSNVNPIRNTEIPFISYPVRILDIFAPLANLPTVIVIVLGNVYIRLFYRLRERMDNQ